MQFYFSYRWQWIALKCMNSLVFKLSYNNQFQLEHCVSSAKVVGSIPREHTQWKYKCISWKHCKSLWIKASAKCINENIIEKLKHAVFTEYDLSITSVHLSITEQSRLVVPEMHFYSSLWCCYTASWIC